MKRLLFSTIGVILTFAWIIYTAPDKGTKAPVEPIKTINRSGAESIKKISQPKQRNEQHARNRNEALFLNSNAGEFIIAANETE